MLLRYSAHVAFVRGRTYRPAADLLTALNILSFFLLCIHTSDASTSCNSICSTRHNYAEGSWERIPDPGIQTVGDIANFSGYTHIQAAEGTLCYQAEVHSSGPPEVIMMKD